MSATVVDGSNPGSRVRPTSDVTLVAQVVCNPDGSSISGGGSGSVTPNSAIVSGAGTIPINSKGWTFTVLTGTATFNGAASLPAGFSDSDTNPNAAAINYDATGGTAYVRYNA